MTSVDKLGEALTEWTMNVAKSVLPNVKIQPQSGIGSFMQMLGVDTRTYSIYDELGFLFKPTMRRFIQPTLAKYLSGMTDAEIEEMVMEYVEAMRQEAANRGYINIFGIQVGANAFDGLKEILIDKFR
jgi:hypothetical protein